MNEVTWKDEPDEHDFPAASDYLLLLAAADVADDLVQRLRDAPTGHWKAKDILRAAGLPLLPVDNPHVAADLRKILSEARKWIATPHAASTTPEMRIAPVTSAESPAWLRMATTLPTNEAEEPR